MTRFRTAMTVVAMAAALTASQAMAADGPALAPGKPAGVQAAQHGSHLLLIAGAAALLVGGVVIAIATSNNSGCGSACSTPATSS